VNPYGNPEHSFWRDLLESTLTRARGGLVPDEVLLRMQAHDRSFGDVARRSVGTAGLGSLIPEQPEPPAAWGVPVSRRPFVDAFLRAGGGMPLPPTGMVVSVPSSLTAGVAAVSQTAENFTPTESTPVYLNRSSTLVTIVAEVAVSRQAFERGSNLDDHLTIQCRAALDSELERQVFAGTGTNGELTGLIASASYVSLSATFAHNIVRASMQASRLTAEAAKVPAQVVAMHPRRWQHISADVLNSSTSWDSVAWDPPGLGSTPVVQSAAIPTTLGAATNEDRILSLIPGVSAYLALDAPRVTVFPEPHAGVGTVRLVASQYAALVTRSPTVVQCVSGAGLVAPAAFG
jgi:hypothetical protein